MLLQNPVFPTDAFGVYPEDKTMSCEASTLGIRSPEYQLYDDACDVGICLRSHKTGKLASFYVYDVDKDASDEDIYGWHLKPCPESLRKCPELKGWTVLIIND